MDNDMKIRQHVVDELDFTPSVDTEGIGVIIEDGVVEVVDEKHM